MTGKEAPNKRNMQKFVRYAEGAKMYSMGLSKFQELAKDAKACYKVGQLVLVNTEILDEYLETFRIVEDEKAKEQSENKAKEAAQTQAQQSKDQYMKADGKELPFR